MEIQRFFLNALILTLPLLLFACEDPSNVGVGFIGDEEGGIPETHVVPLDSFDVIPNNGIRENLSRVLAGQVADPTFGTIRAEGFIDIRSNSDLPEAYEAATVEQALLQFAPGYLYGDTVETLTFALHEVLTEFELTGNTEESIPDIGPELLQFSFSPREDTVEVALPDSWVAQYDEALRSTAFGNEFHGFKLVPVSGNAVIGFQNNVGTAIPTLGISRLLGIAAGDTVAYVADKSLTRLSKLTEANLPPDRVVLQNGFSSKIALNFSIDDLADNSLNRASLELRIDTEAMQTPQNFVRPRLNTLRLIGVVKVDSLATVVSNGTRNEDEFYRFVFNNAIVPFFTPTHLNAYPQYDGLNFHEIWQKILLGGENPFLSYDIAFFSATAGNSNTLDGIVFYDDTSVSNAPSIYATTIPR